MVRVEDIFVVFNSGTPLERVALRGVNFTVNDGEIVSIVGNNGSGRTTLLRFLAGHIVSSFGKFWLNKVDITHQTLAERSKHVSTVFYDETTGSAGNLTLLENLALASLHHQERSLFAPAIDDEMREVFYQQLKELNFMGMEEMLDTKVKHLSRSHRHVLALLIAVIKETELLLIDEHLTGLDPMSVDALQEVTNRIIKDRKVTTIMAVSDPKFAFSVSDKVFVLNHGQIVKKIDAKTQGKPNMGDVFESFSIVPIVKDVPKDI